jgi:hypothetical protein
VAAAKPDATVLAVHPRLRTGRGAPMPVIVAGDHGAGRTLAITTDSLWRYGFVAASRPGDDGRAYTKLWENAVRWLIQDPDLRNLHVDSDAVEYAPGATVRLTARLLGRDYQPLPKGKVAITLAARRRSRGPRWWSATTTVTVGDDGTGSLRSDAACRRASTGSRPRPRWPAAQGHRHRHLPGPRRLARARRARRGAGHPRARIAAATGGRALGPVDRLPVDLAFDLPRVVRVDQRDRRRAVEPPAVHRAWSLGAARPPSGSCASAADTCKSPEPHARPRQPGHRPDLPRRRPARASGSCSTPSAAPRSPSRSKLLDPDMLDPRIEMELSPSIPFRRRGERRLMIIDDSAAAARRSAGAGRAGRSAAGQGRAPRAVRGAAGASLGRLFALGAWGDAVLVARSARDLRGDLPGRRGRSIRPPTSTAGAAPQPLARAEFEAKIMAYDKRLDELDEDDILACLPPDANLERRMAS